jgi:hypothetical protein
VGAEAVSEVVAAVALVHHRASALTAASVTLRLDLVVGLMMV